MGQQRLGPFEGRYTPDYQLTFWADGDPRSKITQVDLRSAIAIQTSKSLDDISGTFTITVKDPAFRHYVKEMDVVRIRLRGHDGHGLSTVMRGVVDTVRAGGDADPYASREDTVIEGRDLGKYLQVTSMFLPVWDPTGALPTALIFGLGDASKKVGGNTPFDIFDYIVKRFMWGSRRLAGVSGIPNSRFWVDHKQRFDKINFTIPFLQFDEDDLGTALKRLEVLGYTEAWVDEVGNVVFRHPPWDQAARYLLPTGSMKEWDFPRTDIGCATYVEVIPAGDPGIDSATAQALRAGRAPVPSSYLAALSDSKAGGNAGGGPTTVDPDYIIDTDTKGNVTAKGRKNFWYRRQRRLGLRPQQITQPLIFTQEQAQAQAQGLLRFYGRMIKTAQVTIPGVPTLRLGENARVFGPLDGQNKDTAYYIDSVAHEYVEGQSYDTTFHGSHGRDPWDPKWGAIVLPKYDPSKLSTQGGILDPGSGASTYNGQTGKVKLLPGTDRRPDGQTVPLAGVLMDCLAAIAGVYGHTVVVSTGSNHPRLTQSGNVSDHWTGHAADLGMVANNGTNDGPVGDAICEAALIVCGATQQQARAWASRGGLFGRNSATQASQSLDFDGHSVQIIWKTDIGGDHHNHVHVGVQ